MRILAVIPARYASTRFPGKPLALLAGKPMVRHIWEKCCAAGTIERVIVATDDERIAAACREFGAEVEMTDPELPSGTDRVAAVAERHSEFDGVLNIQGDEPAIAPATIDAVVALLRRQGVEIASAVADYPGDAEPDDPDKVKVALTASFRALYFSRAPIPFVRNPAAINTAIRYRHLGLYGFRRETLQKVTQLPPSRLERLESLEQLRWLEADYEIYCAHVTDDSVGVDTPEDLRALEIKLLNQD